MGKSIQEMERSELIGMVKALQRQVEDLTGPERTRYYQLGRLSALAGETAVEVENEAQTPFWKRLTAYRSAG